MRRLKGPLRKGRGKGRKGKGQGNRRTYATDLYEPRERPDAWYDATADWAGKGKGSKAKNDTSSKGKGKKGKTEDQISSADFGKGRKGKKGKTGKGHVADGTCSRFCSHRRTTESFS